MIEFIGFDEVWTKINNLDRLQSISLADCRICDLGMAGHLSALLRNLRILSLEDNLLSHWDQVLQLGIELPLLNELSLTNNLFESVEENYSAKQTYKFIGREETLKCPEISTIYKNLRCLILINTKLTWQTFIRVLPLFT